MSFFEALARRPVRLIPMTNPADAFFDPSDFFGMLVDIGAPMLYVEVPLNPEDDPEADNNMGDEAFVFIERGLEQDTDILPGAWPAGAKPTDQGDYK